MAAAGLPALGGLDGVEIKLNFDAAQIDDALRVFGFAAGEGKPRRIWFGEVLDGVGGPGALPLSTRGIVLRVRAKKNGGDVTVKLRCADGGIDVPAWREGAGRNQNAKIEGDWAGKRLVSASLGDDFNQAAMRELEAAHPSIASLLSSEQHSLAEQLLIPLGRVTLLGPISAQKWEAGNGGDVEAEMWEVDTLRFLEISALVTEDPSGVMEQLRQRAEQGGLKIAAGQDTKTTTVLQHLAAKP